MQPNPQPRCRGRLPLRMRCAILLLALFWLATSLNAETIRVPRDHKTIQAGIDAAKPGDTVLVDAGLYQERIRLKAGIIVKSAGDDTPGKLGLKRAEKTIIDGNYPDAEGPGVVMAENSTLDGLTVTGVGTYDAALWEKHHATHGEQQSHEHIGAPGTAGIAVIGVTHCTVSNNIVHHIGYTGIAIMGEKGKRVSPHIVHNIAYRNMGGGIGSMKESTAVIEDNICFENFYAGIGHNNASPTVIKNKCYGNIRAGIGISEHSKPIVRGNTCYRNRRAGIGIRTGAETSPLVEHNECYENDMSGIGARDDATPMIRFNRCYKNAMAGIGCRTGAQPMIVGNECSENKLAGIGVQNGADAVIRRNRCVKNGQTGIGVQAHATATIFENTCSENSMVAIGVTGGSQALILRNKLHRTGGMPPLLTVLGKSSAEIRDNLLQGGGVAGLLVDGTADVTNNRFEGSGPRGGPGPPHFAVWVRAGSDVIFSHNHVHRWRHALSASGARRVRAMDNTVRRFLGTAIVVNKSELPAHVFGNVAMSDNAQDQAVQVEGHQGIVAENKRIPLTKSPQEGSDNPPDNAP